MVGVRRLLTGAVLVQSARLLVAPRRRRLRRVAALDLLRDAGRFGDGQLGRLAQGGDGAVTSIIEPVEVRRVTQGGALCGFGQGPV